MRVEMGTKAPIKLWTDHVPVEESALAQLRNIASLPFIFKHVAVMPDVHLGIGATVGSVIPTIGAIIPAAVGVDIGCGMLAVKTSLRAEQLPDSLADYRSRIEAVVPVGNGPGGAHRGLLNNDVTKVANELWLGYKEAIEPHKILGDRLSQQLGTLGGGNHFIEICLDQEGSVWVMLHSGSRGIGNKIGQHFIEVAREDMRTHFINLPDRDLAYFPEGTEHFDEYFAAVLWAQKYAKENRLLMMTAILSALDLTNLVTDQIVHCHHNYVAREHHFGKNILVTRKGAVNAAEGTLGIIPGSMGQRSYIIKGKGNPDSFNSCSHGAGRAMSRTEARKRFTTKDLEEQTEGVECRKDEGVVDEIPSAYKDLDAVMESQKDLVEIVFTLKAILTVKG